MSKRLLIPVCLAALVLTACSEIPQGEVNPGSGVRFVPQVADYLDNAGLGNEITLNKDGVPFISYLIFPAIVKEGEIPVSRPIGAPYIKTAADTDTPAEDGGAVGIASLAENGVWTRGAAAQSRETPEGVTIPYDPAFDATLIGANAKNTNGTDIAIGDDGSMHVVWTGKDGVSYANAPSTGGFTVEKVFDYGFELKEAGPIGRPSVALDDKGTPWVVYAVDAGTQEIQVATKEGDKWTTQTAASVKLCNGCAQPLPVRIGMTAAGPVVAYVDVAAKRVMAAHLQNGSWVSEQVATGVSGDGLAMAVGKDGKVYLSFYTGDGAVDVAVGDGSSWTVAKVADAAEGNEGESATDGNFMQTTGVAVDDQGTTYVTWYDGDSDSVKLAKTSDLTTFDPVQTQDTDGGMYPSVAVTPDGTTVYVSWYGSTNQDLRLGVQGDLQGLAVAVPSPTPSTTQPSGPTNCGASGQVALDISAQNIAYDTNCLVADAGKPFTVTFDNKDTGIAHNFDLLTKAAGDQIGATDLTPGPATEPLKVDALDAGTYYFQCDAHPTTMTGALVVVKAKGAKK